MDTRLLAFSPALLLAAIFFFLSGCSPAMRGGEAMARGDYGVAVQYYREDLSRNPDSLASRRKLGRALYELGDFDAAEAVLGEVLARKPGDWEASYTLSLALIARGRREAGFDALRETRAATGAYWLKMETACVADRVQDQDLSTPETLDLLTRYRSVLAKRQELRAYRNHAGSLFFLAGDCPPMLHEVNYYLGTEW